MLSRELQVTLQLAVTEAVNRRHEYVCLEHLLYAMLHDVTTSNILQNSGADLEELKKKLTRYLDEQVERMPKGETVMPRYAIGVQRALRAALHVQSSGRNEINGGNVLVAMFQETESPAHFFLQEQNVSRFDVINFISHGVSKASADSLDPACALCPSFAQAASPAFSHSFVLPLLVRAYIEREVEAPIRAATAAALAPRSRDPPFVS